MQFSIPILIQERPGSTGAGTGAPLFVVRPVFHGEPEQKSEKLSRALNKLNTNLHELLRGLGDEQRHDDLAEWSFSPSLHQRTLELRLNLKSGAPLKTFFLVHYEALDRQICFFPWIADLSFELLSGQKLEERATEVLNEFVREKEKSDETFSVDSLALEGKARLSVAEIDLTPAAHGKRKKKRMRALLFGGEEKKSGEQELRKVGQGLHQWYPDDLERALGRGPEVEELARLFSLRDRRPILLVGPQKVGKTAIIHELAWQISHRKKEKFGHGREIWLLSPMRLISGMSYLGEWENRVNAIIDHARDQDHVLYFEDLLGLFTAGMSSASDLNVAQVLKPHLEKRSVRILAEITPDALRVLREKDRSFADLFQVVPVEEPSESEVWRVLIHLVRELEGEQQCAFDLDLLPLVHDLHRRYLRDAAFPGKAAGFLRRLAVRHKNGKVSRADALEEFSRQTGLRTSFVAEAETVSSRLSVRAELLRLLGAQLKGQDQVLEAFADVLLSFRAGLNDPARPIGTMLLLGPTGVGKTESAKALAQILFRSADRLMRFDLNEFVDARAVARLTGTVQEPDGLLTGAVRRQPFSVILFDEIEKAAPEVFDLLLAVLDEGRLSDSLGRVADFTNCIILLSSNLGAREARSRLGFGATNDANEDAIYISAAERFFRPEFFNRLDRIIPFRALSEPELDAIAQRLLAQIQTRDGLRRRDCTLTLTDAARRRLVELGHHPRLGARALKRTMEREVVQRLAEKIAATPPSLPVVARIDADAGEFVLDVQALGPTEVTAAWVRDFLESEVAQTPESIDGVSTFLERVKTQIEAFAPSGAIEWARISPEQAHYYFCREQLTLVQRLLDGVKTRARQVPRQTMRVPKTVPRKFLIRQMISGDPRGKRLRDRVDLQLAMSDFNAEETRETSDSPLLNLLRESAFLHSMLASKPASRAAVLAFVRAADYADVFLVRIWSEFFKSLWGGDNELADITLGQFPIAGPYLELFLPQDGANIMMRDRSGGWTPACIRVTPADGLEAAQLIAKRQTFESVPGPVIARYDKAGAYTDYRTGLAIADAAHMSPQDFRALMLSTLPLPPELG